jgi:hypothetical protein
MALFPTFWLYRVFGGNRIRIQWHLRPEFAGGDADTGLADFLAAHDASGNVAADSARLVLPPSELGLAPVIIAREIHIH